jgi:hydrogenase maturation factor
VTAQCEPDGHCITCSDEGLPMRVLGCGSTGVASCIDDDGRWSLVMVDLLDRVEPGDEVLVHAGVALMRLDQAVPA